MADARDRSDAIIQRFDPLGRASRRNRFEPYDGDGARWKRYEEVVNHRGEWHTVATELVESLAFENVPADAVDDYEREATPAETRLDDPEWADDQQALGE